MSLTHTHDSSVLTSGQSDVPPNSRGVTRANETRSHSCKWSLPSPHSPNCHVAKYYVSGLVVKAIDSYCLVLGCHDYRRTVTTWNSFLLRFPAHLSSHQVTIGPSKLPRVIHTMRNDKKPFPTSSPRIGGDSVKGTVGS